MVDDLNDVLVMLLSISELLMICHHLGVFSFSESLYPQHVVTICSFAVRI